ncbi:hypothetical protein [Paenibacillus sp. TH7-28]
MSQGKKSYSYLDRLLFLAFFISPIIATNAGEAASSLETYTGPVQAGGSAILKAVLKT